MRRDPAHRARSRIVFGAIAIGVGLLALLDNFGLFDFRAIQPYWPLLLVVSGLLKLRQTRHFNGALVGGTLIVVGAVLTLHNLGYLRVHLRDWWPLFLIVGGVLVVSRGLQNRGEGDDGATSFAGRGERREHGSRIDASALLSGSVLRNDTQDFQGGEITAVMGGIEIDLRKASITGDAVLNVFAMWGGITLQVPPDWSVNVRAMPLLGGIEQKSVPPMNPEKRLVIEGYVIMGGMEIKN